MNSKSASLIHKFCFLVTRSLFGANDRDPKAVNVSSVLMTQKSYPLAYFLLPEIECSASNVLLIQFRNHTDKQETELYQYGESLHVTSYHVPRSSLHVIPSSVPFTKRCSRDCAVD